MEKNKLIKQLISTLPHVKSNEARKSILLGLAGALKGSDVKKALDPETQTLLQNIISMVNQIQQMNQSGETIEMREENEDEKTQDPILERQKEDEDDKDKEKAEKSDNGSTASDDAEERKEEDLTESTKEAIAEVQKAIEGIGNNKKESVNMSSVSNAIIMDSVSDIAKSVKSIVGQQNQNTKAIENLLGGLEITDKIKKSAEIAKSEKRPKPVLNTDDAANFLKEINKSLSNMDGREVKKEESEAVKNMTARESLGSVMKALLVPAAN